MLASLLDRRPRNAVAIHPLSPDRLAAFRRRLPAVQRRWLDTVDFKAQAGSLCLLPDGDGGIAAVLSGSGAERDPWQLAHLPAALPAGDYYVEAEWAAERHALAALGFALACYQFTRYRASPAPGARLALHPDCDSARLRRELAAIGRVRDLVNTPAQDLPPQALGEAVRAAAKGQGARVREVVGRDLLRQRYPAIHAVGRASEHPPRLLDLRWGETRHPRVTLVGKGVCFDTGGLNLKSAAGMRLMKKDMGGAAHAIALAGLIMESGLPVRLRLLVAAVENSVAGNAYRPGDVIASRKGLSIEIDNTDAEGRVIMADALAAGAEESPALMIDFSTLTGAARVALGPELPAMFCNRDEVADGVLAEAAARGDPLWRMPLHAPYREMLESRVADIVNSAGTGLAGAITAALFLERFVPAEVPWMHFDLMAWNPRQRPGRPEGGEAMALRAVFGYLERRFAGA